MSKRIVISTEGAIPRLLLVVAVSVFAVCSFFVVRWTVGSAVARNAEFKEIAEYGVSFAPSNPWTHYYWAELLSRTFLPQDVLLAEREYEVAVSLSPQDYRLWIELGKAYERSGKSERSEIAYRQALLLAPNYSEVQWAFGNFLLRVGKPDEGFVLIGKAASTNLKYSTPAAAIAWALNDGEIEKIKPLFSGSDYLKAGLAQFLVSKSEVDAALDVWTSVENKSAGDLKSISDDIFHRLQETKQFGPMVRFLALQSGRVPVIGQVMNGEFEEEIKISNQNPFDWVVNDGSDAQIGIDTAQERDGKKQRTLAVLFKSNARKFSGVSQRIAVSPGGSYQLKVSYKSDLKFAATFKWQIVDAKTGALIAETEPIKQVSDWASQAVQLKIPFQSDGIVLNLVRAGCVADVCPIEGRFWVDGVVLSAN